VSLELADEQATLSAGARLAAALAGLDALPEPGLHLHLRGELGAGKTTLARGLLRGLGVRGPVKSPTYTLVEPYPGAVLPVYHFDLYRLGCAEELELLGARDYFRPGVLCLFEWPERGADWLPAPSLELLLTHRGPARGLELQARDPVGEILASALLSA
jgi:tRNA threonylcarbamoyladenosine biosynthesis protein TsaE